MKTRSSSKISWKTDFQSTNNLCTSSAEWFSFLATIFAGLMLFSGFSMTYNWLSRFGKIQTTDEEFIAVKKQVRNAQTIWVWANIINLIWLIVFVKFF
jgi:hypothetical protein